MRFIDMAKIVALISSLNKHQLLLALHQILPILLMTLTLL